MIGYNQRFTVSYIVAIGMVIGVCYGSMSAILIGLGINIIFLGFIVLMDFSKDDYIFDSISKQIFGVIYVPFLLSLLVLIYKFENGHLWVLWLLFITFANDTGAYYAGTFYGKRHLAPNISPKKTYMGTIGGVVSSVFIGFVFCYLFFHNLEKAFLAIPCSILIAVAGQVGDLFASALKRTSGVKDSGVILPGHGGMLDRIEQNTENAEQTNRIALKASEDISEGQKSFEITLQAMKDIAKKIIMIGDIAEKTDLLAINAAVEAARAGEHGQGFAVVASEIRKLAETSQKAANAIDELSSNSVNVAEKSTKLLAEIVPNVQRTAQLVQEITATSTEQTSGITQINNAVQQLSQVTQQNSSSAEEMATGTEELASQSEQLKSVIAFFNTGNNKLFVSKKENPEFSYQDKKVAKEKGINLDLNETDNDYETF